MADKYRINATRGGFKRYKVSASDPPPQNERGMPNPSLAMC